MKHALKKILPALLAGLLLAAGPATAQSGGSTGIPPLDAFESWLAKVEGPYKRQDEKALLALCDELEETMTKYEDFDWDSWAELQERSMGNDPKKLQALAQQVQDLPQTMDAKLTALSKKAPPASKDTLKKMKPALEESFEFEATDESFSAIRLTKYKNLMPHLVLPSSIQGLPVTEISKNFTGSHILVSVVIPESITVIPEGAFSDCTNLSTVLLPSKTTRIEKNAFKGCKSLQGIELPEGLSYIGSEAFAASGLTAVSLPKSLTLLGNRAFADCDNLAKITVPKGHAISNESSPNSEQDFNSFFSGKKIKSTIALQKLLKETKTINKDAIRQQEEAKRQAEAEAKAKAEAEEKAKLAAESAKKAAQTVTKKADKPQDYASLLANAKAYEKAGKYVSALGSYWDAMLAAPEKAEAAQEAYNRISGVLKKWKSSDMDIAALVKDMENLEPNDKLSEIIRKYKRNNNAYDEFDEYDFLNDMGAFITSLDIGTDYATYWAENNAYCIRAADLKKGDLDMKTRTASYKAKIYIDLSKKYKEIQELVFGSSSQRELYFGGKWALPENFTVPVDFGITLGITGSDGKHLVTGKPIALKTIGTADYTFTGVDRGTMNVIDGGGCKPEPVSVTCKGTDVSKEVQYNAHALSLVQLAQINMDCASINGFCIMKTEVTKELYQVVTDFDSSYSSSTSKYPAIDISWYDAIEFCNRLSEMQGLTPCYSLKGYTDPDAWDRSSYFDPYYGEYKTGYSADEVVWNENADGWRLPTEAEWLLAADDGHTYSGSDNIDEVAWYSSNSYGTHEVATKKPNAKGIYDMTGNVWEWCWDKYEDTSNSYSYHRIGRVLRGGSYSSYSSNATVSYQNCSYPDSSGQSYGFRLARNADAKILAAIKAKAEAEAKAKAEAEEKARLKAEAEAKAKAEADEKARLKAEAEAKAKAEAAEKARLKAEAEAKARAEAEEKARREAEARAKAIVETYRGRCVEVAGSSSGSAVVEPFILATTEVTQELYEAVTASAPSANKGKSLPVENVRWLDAVAFCNRLSVMHGLTPCYSVRGSTDTAAWKNYKANDVAWDADADGWRLPTEAEWQLAADDGHTYSGSDNIKEVAWYDGNSGGKTHEAAGKRPNAKGIYDMTGNVGEWCWDKYGSMRVIRGGDWNNSAARCDITNTDCYAPDGHSKYLGFRVARNADEQTLADFKARVRAEAEEKARQEAEARAKAEEEERARLAAEAEAKARAEEEERARLAAEAEARAKAEAEEKARQEAEARAKAEEEERARLAAEAEAKARAEAEERARLAKQGWMGAEFRDISGEYKKELGLKDRQQGAFVQALVMDGPAMKAGMQPGDFIIELGKYSIKDSAQLMDEIKKLPAGSSCQCTVLRGGHKEKLSIRIAGTPAEDADGSRLWPGMTVVPLSAENRRTAGINDKHVNGVLIREILAASPADALGLQENLVITAVNSKKVSDLEEFFKELDSSKKKTFSFDTYGSSGASYSTAIYDIQQQAVLVPDGTEPEGFFSKMKSKAEEKVNEVKDKVDQKVEQHREKKNEKKKK